jgi:hypothetical protein
MMDKATHVKKATIEQRTGGEQITRAAGASVMIDEISRATSEQSKNSGLIISAATSIRKLTEEVRRATSEQAEGSRQVVNAVEHIHTVTRQNAKRATELKTSVSVLLKQSDTLRDQIAIFHRQSHGLGLSETWDMPPRTSCRSSIIARRAARSPVEPQGEGTIVFKEGPSSSPCPTGRSTSARACWRPADPAEIRSAVAAQNCDSQGRRLIDPDDMGAASFGDVEGMVKRQIQPACGELLRWQEDVQLVLDVLRYDTIAGAGRAVAGGGDTQHLLLEALAPGTRRTATRPMASSAWETPRTICRRWCNG